jgi:hypothetical protein
MSRSPLPPASEERVPASVALVSAITAPFFLLLSTVGMSALRGGSEGVRPMVAAVRFSFSQSQR